MKNTPRVWGTKVQEEFDKKRQELLPKIRDYIGANKRFAGLPVTVTFVEKGTSSLVSTIETPQEKVVLKIPLDCTIRGESHFLKIWKQEGVAVPHVIDEGFIGDHPFTLMIHIDAPALDSRDSGELIQEKIYVDIGRTLRAMHRPAAEGYGRFADGHGEFDTFEDWLQGPYVTQRTAYVDSHQILDDTHGSLVAAKNVLVAYVGAGTPSSYCHNDFDVTNIFDTQPLTVFDPSTTLNNGYLDLSCSIILAVKMGGGIAATKQLKEGYFEGESYDARALQAGALLNGYLRIAYLHRAGREESVERIRNYLSQTRQF
ncbi:MAG: aminoglycoside phosphotransferase family protein [bacterium]|nr:aminoglycoside phosphotransferase family protein [bacterium]